MKPIYKHLILSVSGFTLLFLALYFLAKFDVVTSFFVSFGTGLLMFFQNKLNKRSS